MALKEAANSLTVVTQADLERLISAAKMEDRRVRIEVEEGQIVEEERAMTNWHAWIIQTLYDLLKPFARGRQLGWVFMDGARYRLAGAPNDVQRAYSPDISFIRAERLTAEIDLLFDFPFAPDLAVEIVSLGQSNRYFARRVARYLEAGCQEVWIIHPIKHTLIQYRADEDSPRSYAEADTVTTPLLPGFSLSLSVVFAKPMLGQS